MKTVALGVLIGILGTSTFFLMKSEKIIYVEKPVEVIREKEKIVERQVEIEKIIYKKRSCPKMDLERVCSEYALSLHDAEEKLLTEDQPEVSISVYTLMPERKNRVNFLVGYGKSGYSMNYDGQSININPKNDWNLGLQYERKLTERFNANLLIQTNKNAAIGFGYDF